MAKIRRRVQESEIARRIARGRQNDAQRRSIFDIEADRPLPSVKDEASNNDGKRPASPLESIPKRVAVEGAPSLPGAFDISKRHHTSVEEAVKIQNGVVNPLTGRAYSERYRQLQRRVGSLPIRQPEQW